MKKVFLHVTCSKVSWETTQGNFTIFPFTICFVSIAPRLVPGRNWSSSTTAISKFWILFCRGQSIRSTACAYDAIVSNRFSILSYNDYQQLAWNFHLRLLFFSNYLLFLDFSMEHTLHHLVSKFGFKWLLPADDAVEGRAQYIILETFLTNITAIIF